MISMLSYKPLSQLIIENKESLTTQLVGKYNHSDVDYIRQACIEYIHSLTKKNSEYMNQLSLLEQDVVSPALSIFEKLPIKLMRGNISKNGPIPHFNTNEINDSYVSSNNLLVGYIISAICGAIGALCIGGVSLLSFVVGISIGAIIGLLLGFVCVKYIKKRYKLLHIQTHCINDSKLNNSYIISIDDVNYIIDFLSNSAKSIDNILNTYRSHIEQLIREHKQLLDKNSLDTNYRDIIETLQYVLGNISYAAESNGALIDDTIRRISSSLMHHGYKVIHYSEDVKAMFQIEFRDTSTIDEFKPAIVKVVDGKEYLIYRGAVVLPHN